MTLVVAETNRRISSVGTDRDDPSTAGGHGLRFWLTFVSRPNLAVDENEISGIVGLERCLKATRISRKQSIFHL
jgi:hypothetical protein